MNSTARHAIQSSLSAILFQTLQHRRRALYWRNESEYVCGWIDKLVSPSIAVLLGHSGRRFCQWGVPGDYFQRNYRFGNYVSKKIHLSSFSLPLPSSRPSYFDYAHAVLWNRTNEKQGHRSSYYGRAKVLGCSSRLSSLRLRLLHLQVRLPLPFLPPLTYRISCNSPPALSFSFGTAKQWTMTPALLSLGTVSLGSTRCVGSIVGQDVGVNAWILGDRFMSGFYSTFDFGGNRVGFSTLA